MARKNKLDDSGEDEVRQYPGLLPEGVANPGETLDLSDEDEAILDRIWDKIAAEDGDTFDDAPGKGGKLSPSAPPRPHS